MIFYTISDIAELFQISYKTANILVKSEGFPKIVIGKSIRVPQDELEKWVHKYSYYKYNI